MGTAIAAVVMASPSRNSARLNAYVSTEKPGQRPGERFVAASGINGAIPEVAEAQMRDNRKRWGKNGTREVKVQWGTDVEGAPLYKKVVEGEYVQAYHVIQSFAREGAGALDPEDPDAWEEAHRLGVLLARDVAGPTRLATVHTQIDGSTGCVHNHIVIDSVDRTTGRSFDSAVVKHALLSATHDEMLAGQGYEQLNQRTGTALERREKSEQRGMAAHALWAASDRSETEPFSVGVLKERIKAALADETFTTFEEFDEVCLDHGVLVHLRGKGLTYAMLRDEPNGDWKSVSASDRRRASTLGRFAMLPAVEEAIARNVERQREEQQLAPQPGSRSKPEPARTQPPAPPVAVPPAPPATVSVPAARTWRDRMEEFEEEQDRSSAAAADAFLADLLRRGQEQQEASRRREQEQSVEQEETAPAVVEAAESAEEPVEQVEPVERPAEPAAEPVEQPVGVEAVAPVATALGDDEEPYHSPLRAKRGRNAEAQAKIDHWADVDEYVRQTVLSGGRVDDSPDDVEPEPASVGVTQDEPSPDSAHASSGPSTSAHAAVSETRPELAPMWERNDPNPRVQAVIEACRPWGEEARARLRAGQRLVEAEIPKGIGPGFLRKHGKGFWPEVREQLELREVKKAKKQEAWDAGRAAAIEREEYGREASKHDPINWIHDDRPKELQRLRRRHNRVHERLVAQIEAGVYEEIGRRPLQEAVGTPVTSQVEVDRELGA